MIMFRRKITETTDGAIPQAVCQPALVYHCFDRMVINGYLSGLSPPAQVVHFFREVGGVPAITRGRLGNQFHAATILSRLACQIEDARVRNIIVEIVAPSLFCGVCPYVVIR